MDPQLRLVRNRMVQLVVRRAAVAWLVVVAVVLAVLWLQTGELRLWWIPAVALLGQVLVAAWLLTSVYCGPLDLPYLRRYVATVPSVPAAPRDPPPPEVHAAAVLLAGCGVRPLLPVGDGETGIHDIFQNGAATVTAVRSRGTGALAVLSRLSDGRILHTDALALPPSGRLVVNTVGGADARQLMEAHRDAVRRLASAGVAPVPDSPRLWLEALDAEREAYADLGPLLGSLCYRHLSFAAGGRTATTR
jgi:hypothetical protein